MYSPEPIKPPIIRDVPNGVRKCTVISYRNRLDLMKAKPSKKNEEKAKSFLRRCSGSWYGSGISSIRDINKMCNQGWKYGERQVDKLLHNVTPLIPRVKRLRRKLRRSDQGDEVDIHAVWSGNLDRAWSVAKRTEAIEGIRKAEIWLQPGANASVSAKDMVYGALAAVVLAESFIKQNISVKVGLADYAIRASFGSGDSWSNSKDMLLTQTLKDFDAPLNRRELVLMSHPGFYRTYFFRCYCATEDTLSWGLGQAKECPEDLLPKKPRKTTRFIVPMLRSETAVVDYLNSIFRRQKEGVLDV